MEKENILKRLNLEVKCISLTAKGIKVYDKRIDIANILKIHSEESSIPAKEEFELFDFEGAESIAKEEYNLKLKKLVDEGVLEEDNRYLFIKQELEKTTNNIELYKKEYKILKKVCREVEKVIEEIRLLYIGDLVNSTKLILTENLNDVNKKLRTEIKTKINEKRLDKSIEFFKIVLYKNILQELKRHKVEHDSSEANEISREIDEMIDIKLRSIPNAKNMIVSIEPKLNYILDIAEETLESEVLKNKIISFLNENDKTELADLIDGL
ncbi:MAG: hypothetical protein ACRCWM_04085 [Sarcina sp.]